MFFDPVRNAYIDKDTNEVIFQEDGPSDTTENTTIISNEPVDHQEISFDALFDLAAAEHVAMQANFQENPHTETDHQHSRLDHFEIGQDEDAVATHGASGWDDWNLARTMQMLEFEISNEMMDGYEGGEACYMIVWCLKCWYLNAGRLQWGICANLQASI